MMAFCGNSLIGEWVNIGADTNVSNLKNNYADVRLWNYEIEKFKTPIYSLWINYGRLFKCE